MCDPVELMVPFLLHCAPECFYGFITVELQILKMSVVRLEVVSFTIVDFIRHL